MLSSAALRFPTFWQRIFSLVNVNKLQIWPANVTRPPHARDERGNCSQSASKPDVRQPVGQAFL